MVFFSHRTKRESPAGEQFWKFSRQCSIFGCIGDQWVAIIFEPWKKRTLHPIREQLNTSTKYNSDSLLSFYSLNFKKQKLNVPSYTCSRRMSSLSFSSPSTSPWTPASSLPGKKRERECDDKVKELHCKHSAGLEIIFGYSPVTMTGQIHFCSVTYRFWPVKCIWWITLLGAHKPKMLRIYFPRVHGCTTFHVYITHAAD